MSGHTHHKHHHHSHEEAGKRLLLATLLNIVITIAEVVGGLLSNSLALISDALHNMGDAFAVALSYFAIRIGRRGSDHQKTFGYQRAEILVALLNTTVLIAVCIFLFFEAWQRLQHPEPIKGGIMMLVAFIGLLANLATVLLLHRDAQKNINTRSAYLHLLGDTLSSVAVIAGGILIYFFHIYWVDPLVTFLVGLYMIRESYSVLKETINILMQSKPHGLDLDQLKSEIEGLPDINNIHHIHVWRLTDSSTYFECHIDVCEDMPLSKTSSIRHNVETLLSEKFGINHFTTQFEFNCCANKDMIHPKEH
jgi:cobalt-zinc-cadmium efflux system protein